MKALATKVNQSNPSSKSHPHPELRDGLPFRPSVRKGLPVDSRCLKKAEVRREERLLFQASYDILPIFLIFSKSSFTNLCRSFTPK